MMCTLNCSQCMCVCVCGGGGGILRLGLPYLIIVWAVGANAAHLMSRTAKCYHFVVRLVCKLYFLGKHFLGAEMLVPLVMQPETLYRNILFGRHKY